MPDDERRGGTHSSAGDSNGYGRRHRRAEEPTEQPRRRRRSMEDGPGGLSVADLVQRHSNSRQDLNPVAPPPGEPRSRRNLPPANQPPRRPVEGQGNGRRPGETAGGPQWPDQTNGQPPGRRATAAPHAGQAFPEDPAGRGVAPGHAGFPEDPAAHATGRRALPESRPPGQASGRRALPDDPAVSGRRAPGQATGHHALPDAPPPAPPGGRRALPDGPPPSQVSGRRALPDVPPPGHTTGRRALPDLAGGRAPGQATGHRAFPEDPAGRAPAPGPAGFPEDPAGPGQASVRRPVPPPNGRQAPPSRQPSGPLPANDHPAGPPMPGQSSRHPSVPVPDDRPSNPGRPGAVPGAIPIADDPAGPPVPRGQAGPGSKSRMNPAVPLPPPRPPAEDAISMTTEMEAIGEEVQKRRSIDHTIARFSAVHDELQAEERKRKAKRRKLMPWQHEDEEFDRLDEMVGMQTIAVPQSAPDPEPELQEVMAPAGSTRLQEKKSRRRNKSALAVRVFAATAAILVFVATGIAWGFKAWVDASSQQVDALDPDSAAIQDAAKQQGDENFLLVGSDTRAGAAAEEGVGDEKDIVGARSDTVMIAHIPADRQRVVVVSFPRDLQVTRPKCEGWDPKSGDYTGDQKPDAQQVKLNTAYQVGGPMCVTKLVQELSGLKINHFVGIDFHGFKDMVDAVRGVQVCVERPLKDDILGTVVPQAGKNVTLSGDQALNFVRARHVEGDLTSDYGRIKRQQRFLSSLLRKAMSTEVLLDPGKLTGFVNAFSKSTFGDNIGVDQMMVLGQSMQGIEAGRVTFITVPTVGEANDNGNEDLKVEDTNALFSAIRNDNPLPGEAPANPSQAQAGLRQEPVDPSTIKLQVLNGGNPTEGIAGDTADELAELGFKIVWVDTAPEPVDRTVIKYSKEGAAAASTVKAAVPNAELVEDPSMGSAVQLIVGPGFDRKVVSPKGGGAPPPKLPNDLSTINAGDVSCA
ncbi:MAG: LytR family transcriptional regulator [Actinophytocola sp.]|uniref:LCP family protein n=1 Tax=Actinophytocola sp. TaxID=1872138 RepID=UPI001322D61C|nr:LCP family protein [Actinophytocola sp.]MPZ80542.1 LytR family transcriptional regulator [Actinophytocola sp.]